MGFVISLFGGPGGTVTDIIKTIGQLASILIVMALAFLPVKTPAVPFSEESDGGTPVLDEAQLYSQAVMRRMAWAFAAVVLMASMIQPWYMLWLLAFFAMTGIKEGWQMRTVLYLSAFFTLIALTDQLSVFPWIPVVLVRTVAIVVGLASVLFVMFGDKKTRGLFVPKWEIAAARDGAS
ncbi:hypothetical protein NHF46_13700 [Arthrobacter alpinus]|nr:hypothetical protein [Arthrobacter alpinus]